MYIEYLGRLHTCQLPLPPKSNVCIYFYYKTRNKIPTISDRANQCNRYKVFR